MALTRRLRVAVALAALKRAKRLNPARAPGPPLSAELIARIEALDLEPSAVVLQQVVGNKKPRRKRGNCEGG
jgi:hypothetical protein